MHRAGDLALAFQHCHDLAFQVEVGNHPRAAKAQLVEPVAQAQAAQEAAAVGHHRQVVVHRLHRAPGVPAAGVVDGHVQLEIVRIDAQLAQLMGADQQVQRQLLVAKVVADQLRQVTLTQMAQRQLQGALDVMRVAQPAQLQAVVGGQQLAIQQHMVLPRLAVAQFFQIGLHQRLQMRLPPVRQHAVEPGAVDQLGRRHRAQKVQGMGAVAEVMPRLAFTARLQVARIGIGGAPRRAARPGQPLFDIVRQVAGQHFRQRQLGIEEIAGACQGRGARLQLQQRLVGGAYRVTWHRDQGAGLAHRAPGAGVVCLGVPPRAKDSA